MKPLKYHESYSKTLIIPLPVPYFEFDDLSAEQVRHYIVDYPDWLVSEILERLNKFEKKVKLLNLEKARFSLRAEEDDGYHFTMDALRPMTNSEKEEISIRKTHE